MKKIFFMALLEFLFLGNLCAQGIHYVYDSLGRLAYIQYPDSASIIITYDNGGNVTSKTYRDPCNTKPRPSITTSGATTICDGDTVRLSAMPGLQTSWSNGASTNNIAVTTSGYYYLTRLDSFSIPDNDTIQCLLKSDSIYVTVNPRPIAFIFPPSQSVCNGLNSNIVNFTSTTAGTVFNWVNGRPDLGLGIISDSGAVPVFTAINTTHGILTDSFIVTPVANGCAGPTQLFTIKVNPTPDITVPLDQAVCNRITTSVLNFGSSVTGAAFTWNNSDTSVGLSGSGTGSIDPFLALNLSTSPVTATITATPLANGCAGPPQSFTLTVNPTPGMATPSDMTICNDASSGQVIFSGSVIGTSFSWVDSGASIGLPSSGIGDTLYSFVALNPTNHSLTSSIVITPSANGCADTSRIFHITVNPTPLVDPISNIYRCNGTSVATILFTDSVGGTTFSWTNDNISIGLLATGAVSIPSFMVTNETASPITANISIVPSANGCPGTPFSFTVTVYPTPDVSVPADQSICSNSTTDPIVFTGTVGGTLYSWVNSDTSINLSSADTGSIATFIATNSTPLPVTATINVTPSAYGCIGVSHSLTVTVKPTPTVNPIPDTAWCNGATTTMIHFGGYVAGTHYTWTNSETAIGLPATGADSIASFTATNLDIAPVTSAISILPSVNGCQGDSTTFHITVYPTPTLYTTISPSFCNGITTIPVNFSGPVVGSIFNWTNSDTTIGLAALGVDSLPAFVATNPTHLTRTSAIAIIPSAFGCAGQTNTIAITVFPTPTVYATADRVICNGAELSTIPFSGGVYWTQFHWTSNDASMGLTDTGSDSIASFTGLNLTSVPVIATITVAPSANGCAGIPDTFTITVNPTPVLSSSFTPSAICDSTIFHYVHTSLTPGTMFAWNRPFVAGIGNPSATGVDSLTEYLHNNTYEPISVTYLDTLTANGCTNIQSVTVVVNPLPVLSSTLHPPSICDGATFNYSSLSLTSGTTFVWGRDTLSGIQNPPRSGTDTISEALLSASAYPVGVLYTYTLTANGCANTQSVVDTVYPTPHLSTTLTPMAICDSTAFTYLPTSATIGTTFAWGRATIPGVSNPAATGVGSIGETLINTTPFTTGVTYVYTLTANSCSSMEYVVDSVYPKPALSNVTRTFAICDSTEFIFVDSSLTPGTLFTWQRDVVVGVSNTAGTGISVHDEYLHNTTTTHVTVLYIDTLRANGCENLQFIAVTVNPRPVFSSTLTPPAICDSSLFSYPDSSMVFGYAYAWSRAAVSGIANAGSSGLGNPAETLVNLTSEPVQVVYIDTLMANGCSNIQTVSVIVNPRPLLSSTTSPSPICDSGAFIYMPLSLTSGTSITWSRPTLAGIIEPTSSGGGSINEILYNTTPLPVGVAYLQTLTANGCSFTQSVVDTVYPKPVLTISTTAPGICDSSFFNYVNTSSTPGTTFRWGRPAISGILEPSSSGAGDIHEILSNTTSDPVVVTYLDTLVANGCQNIQSVSVTVFPKAVLSNQVTTFAVCNNTPFIFIDSCLTSGASYSWHRDPALGIVNPAHGGSGNIADTLNNSTSLPVMVLYTDTLLANGCSYVQLLSLTVYPTPLLSSAIAPQSVCDSTLLHYSLTSPTPGTVISWGRSAVAGVSNPAASGLGAVNETLINTTFLPVPVEYADTLRANGCTHIQFISDTVFPKPILSNTISGHAICDSTQFSFLDTCAIPGTVFSWSREVVPGILNPAGHGVGDIYEYLENSTPTPITVQYVDTLMAYGCRHWQPVTVIVNPKPRLTSTLTPPAICDSVPFAYVNSSLTAGLYNSWSRATVPGIANPSTSGTGTIYDTLANITPAPVSVIYVDTLTANGCTNIESILLTVNPRPRLSNTVTALTICDSSNFNYYDSSLTPGTTFSWSRAAVLGVVNPAGSGTGSPHDILVNTTIDPVTVMYVDTLSANGCYSTQVVSVTVNPTPSVNPISNIYRCHGTSVPTILFADSVVGTAFDWTNDNISIGLSAGGADSIPSFTVTNETASAITANISVTPIANGCLGTPFTFTITVYPTPDVVVPADQSICNNATTAPIIFTGAVGGTLFNWINSDTTINLASADTGDIAAFTATNSTSLPVSAIIQVTPSANGCAGLSQNLSVTVLPTPAVNPISDSFWCNGAITSTIHFGGYVIGANYAWTNSETAIGLPGTGADSIGTFTATNIGIAPITSLISILPGANGCLGDTAFFHITVYPTPLLFSTISPSYCNGTLTTPISFSGPVIGTTFNWTSSDTSVGLMELGFDSIPAFVATNTTNLTRTSVVTVQPIFYGCAGPVDTLTVTVYPTPTVDATIDRVFCNGTELTAIPFSGGVFGTRFNWSDNDTSIGLSATGSDSIASFFGVNLNPIPVISTVVVVPLANGCFGLADTFTITVNPTPTLSSTLSPPSICDSTIFYYVPTTSTPGTVYSWSRPFVAGIDNPSGTGMDSILEYLHNTSSDPIGVTYFDTLSANGCLNIQSVTVAVNPRPMLSSVLDPAPICDGTIFSYSASSLTTGTSFSWTRDTIPGILNPPMSGSATIGETLQNVATFPIGVTYLYTLTANGCGNTQTVIDTVYPTPTLGGTLSPSAICDSTLFLYINSSSTPGVTFTWSRASVAGIANAAANGSGDPSEVLHNTSPDPVTVIYEDTLHTGACINIQEVSVVVNPTSHLSSTLTPAAICDSTVLTYVPLSTTIGTTFTWTRDTILGISNAGATGTDSIGEILINTTPFPIGVTYVYTLTANACSSIEYIVDTVYPRPRLSNVTLTFSICDSTDFIFVDSSMTPGTSFTWQRDVVAGVTNPAGAGVSFHDEYLHNSTTSPVTVFYLDTLQANSCMAIQQVAVTVNPLPVFSSTLTPPAICDSTQFNYLDSSLVAGYSYTWGRAAIIGIANAERSGYGNPAETLVNLTVAPILVVYMDTITANGCSNIQVVAVTVNPRPMLNSTVLPPPVCDSGVFNYVPFSLTTGTTFVWVRPATAGILGLGTSGVDSINEVLYNTTPLPVGVSYLLTLSANGCSFSQTFVDTVFPKPLLTSSTTPPGICDSTFFDYINTSATPGVVFKWGRPAIPGILESSSNGTGNIHEILTNTTSDPIVAHYLDTLEANGCLNVQNVSVTVFPRPVLNNLVTAFSVCDNTPFVFADSSLTSGATYSWHRDLTSGILNPSHNGSGNIADTLNNSTSFPVTVFYIDTLLANGCRNTQTISLTVYPTPLLSTSITPQTVCDSTLLHHSLSSATPGTEISWGRSVTAGISNPAAGGVDSISEFLVNTTPFQVFVAYADTLKANGCPHIQFIVDTILPKPVLSNIILGGTICDSAQFSFLDTSATPGTTFSWSRAAVSGILNPTTYGIGGISENLQNTSVAPITVFYVDTLKAYGCKSWQTVTAIVNPKPLLTSTQTPAAVCDSVPFVYLSSSLTSGVSYSWSRASVIGIENSAISGFGAIADTLVNTTQAPITVTYIDTLTANGCANFESILLVVNPRPRLSNTVTSLTVCDSSNFAFIDSSMAVGTTFSWSRAAVSGIVNPASSNTGDIHEILLNSTVGPVVVLYVDTLLANGCLNTQAVSVTVNPRPLLSSSDTATICSGADFVYSPISSSTGATFTWSRSAVPNISPSSSSGSGGIHEALYNSILSPIAVPYMFSLDYYGCPNTQQLMLTVDPVPAAHIAIEPPPSLCSNTQFQNFGADPRPANVNYNWSSENSTIWAADTTRQNCLVSFMSEGDATVKLTANVNGVGCLSADSANFSVSTSSSLTPDVIYTEPQFICLSGMQDSYQWGYDDAWTLDSTILTGEINQNYSNASPDFTNKYYWVMTTHNGCMQKAYANAPVKITGVTSTDFKIDIFPNPTDDLVNIVLGSFPNIGAVQAEVSDMYGQKILQIPLTNKVTKISLSKLASGCYFINCFRNGVKVNSTKMIKI